MIKHTINDKNVHIENPLELVSLGRKSVELLMDKHDYYDMIREDTSLMDFPMSGNKNLIPMSLPATDFRTRGVSNGWSVIQSTSSWTPYAPYNTGKFAREGRLNTLPTTSGYFQYAGLSTKKNDDDSLRLDANFLKPNTTYTISLKYSGMNGMTNNAEPPVNNNGKKTSFSIHVYGNGGSVVQSSISVNDKNLGRTGSGGLDINFGENMTDTQEVVWENLKVTFTTGPVANNLILFRVRYDSSDGAFWITRMSLSELKIEEGDKQTPYNSDIINDIAYTNASLSLSGYRKRRPNFGFMHSEELDFVSLYKLNDMKTPKIINYYPDIDKFRITAEIEVFQIITNVKVYDIINPNAPGLPNDVTRDNSIGVTSHTMLYDNDGVGVYATILRGKAKGGYLVSRNFESVYSSTNNFGYSGRMNVYHTENILKTPDAWIRGEKVYTGDTKVLNVIN